MVTMVVAVLNVLSDSPAVAVGSTVQVVAAATVLGWVAVLVLVARLNAPRGSRGE